MEDQMYMDSCPDVYEMLMCGATDTRYNSSLYELVHVWGVGVWV